MSDVMVYCKNCGNSGSCVNDQCYIPVLDVLNCYKKEDFIETLRVLKSEFEASSNGNKYLNDFDTKLFMEYNKSKSIEDFLMYRMYDAIHSSSYSEELFNLDKITEIYGITKQEFLNNVFDSKYIYGKPSILNANNNCAFYNTKNISTHKVIIKEINKIKLLIITSVSLIIISILIRLLIN